MSSLSPALPLGVIVIALITIVGSPLRGLGRLVSPDSSAAIMVALIFGVRPLFLDRFRDHTIYGYVPSERGQMVAALVGMVFALTYWLGTLLSQSLTRPNFKPLSGTERVLRQDGGLLQRAVLVSVGGCILYVLAVGVFAGPSVLRSLAGGRSAESLGITLLPEFVLIIPLAGSIAAGAVLLNAYKQSQEHQQFRGSIWLAIACIVPSLFFVSQLGNRRYIIPAVLIPALVAIFCWRPALRLWHIIIALALFLLLVTVPSVRAAADRLPGESLLSAAWRHLQAEGIYDAVRPLFTSYDTEMFDFIGVVADRLGGQLQYGFGRGTVLEFLIHPLPSAATPVEPYSDQVLTYFWGGGCGSPVCPEGSLPGIMYFDFSYVGVALGGLILGILLRRLARAGGSMGLLSAHRGLAVAVTSSFVLVGVRTNSIYAAWWLIYTLLLTFAIVRFLSVASPGVTAKPHESRLPATSLKI